VATRQRLNLIQAGVAVRLGIEEELFGIGRAAGDDPETDDFCRWRRS
jgi:hypothetical protein